MIDVLINIHKIKYSVLDDFIKFTDDDTVNLYIDMHTVLSKFYKKNNTPDMINSLDVNPISITTAILNTVAHYRRYFYKKGKSNRIFLVLDKKIPRYQSSLIQYGQIYFDRYSDANTDYMEVNQFFNKVFSFLENLSRYFEDVYFVHTEGIEDSVKIQYLINKYPGQNFIYTKYEHYFQLIENENTNIIFPKRDGSYAISRKNLYDNILDKAKYRPEHINYKMFPIYLMIQGVKARDVVAINVKGKKKLIELLDLMLSEEYITNDVSIQTFVKYFNVLINGTGDNIDLLIKRYQALYVKYGVMALNKSEVNSIENCLVNLFDKNTIEKLNDSLPEEWQINYADLYKAKIMKNNGQRKGWD